MGSLGAALAALAGWCLAAEAAVMIWMNNSVDFYKTCFFHQKSPIASSPWGLLALLWWHRPIGLLWLRPPWWCGWTILLTFTKLVFFRNFVNRIITVGSVGAALVAPCRGSYVNHNTFCMLRRCRCVNNRISVANLCKLQYFLYVASLSLFSKGFQLKVVGFPTPGRSRPGPALRIDAFLKDFN